MDVVVLGHIIIETIVFSDNRIVSPVLGSPAAYSSVILSSLGDKVGLCTKVGEDIPGEFIAVFKQVGVDLAGVRITGKHSTRNKLIYSAPERKSVEYIEKSPKIGFDDLPEDYKDAKIFYLCPMDYEVELHIVKEISRRGIELIVDLGGYGGATSAAHPCGERNSLKATRQVVRYSDVVKTSLEDCQSIFGRLGSSDSENHYLDLMLEMGAKQIVLTLGERGVFYANPGHWESFSSPRCQPVDITGAGDAFAAGMIHNWLKSGNICEAIEFGQATACYVIERTGGVIPERMPTEEDVLSRIKGYTETSGS